jgi:NAD(P)-dependent dehydrogenase (short-subunit alcohol dehydrogenase family)
VFKAIEAIKANDENVARFQANVKAEFTALNTSPSLPVQTIQSTATVATYAVKPSDSYLVVNARGGPMKIVLPAPGGATQSVAIDEAFTYNLFLAGPASDLFTKYDASHHILNSFLSKISISLLGRFGVPGYTAYCASKHGVLGFTRALALELAPRKITVNALCPGWVETDMAEQGMQSGAQALGISKSEFRKQALDAVPLKRIIAPEEVAQLVLYLASPQASAITGQTYNICGGQTMD